MSWVWTFAGTMQFSELLQEFWIPYLEEEQLNQVWEERLAVVLAGEIDENEHIWIDYEYEETQTKIDLGDMIMEQLTDETILMLYKLENRFSQIPIDEESLWNLASDSEKAKSAANVQANESLDFSESSDEANSMTNPDFDKINP